MPLTWTRASSSELSLMLCEINRSIVPQLPQYSSLLKYSRSPVQSLPDDLCSDIFLAASRGPDIYDCVTTPINISHVCRRWRYISISTSALWTTILFTYPSENCQLSRAVNWFFRSKKRPLHIHLDFRDPGWNWEENSHDFGYKDMENAIRLLLPHAARWETMELLTDTWAPIFAFLWYTSQVESAPLLKTIELSRCNAYFAAKGEVFHPVPLKHPVAWFKGGQALTSLSRVSLAGVHVNWSRAGLSGLQELELKYHASDVMPSLQEFADILAGCPKLTRLCILGWGPNLAKTNADDYHPSPAPDTLDEPKNIRLLNLKHFALGFIDVDYAINLVSLFCMPALESLTIEDISTGLLLSDEQLDASPLLEHLISYRLPSPGPSSTASTLSTCCPIQTIKSLQLRAISANMDTLVRFLWQFNALKNLLFSNIDIALLRAILRVLMSSKMNIPCQGWPTLMDVSFERVDVCAVTQLLSLWTEPYDDILDIRNSDISLSFTQLHQHILQPRTKS